MKTITPVQSKGAGSKDPCLPIQVDLSAMLDGELDAASIRRVMVHSDVCPSCKGFLDGIRIQVQAHRELALAGVVEEVCSRNGSSRRVSDPRPQALRKLLLRNRLQLARILYELGRGFVLMGTSPSFTRVVAGEPVPIPDMFLRGRNLLDEVERLEVGDDGRRLDGEWVRAKQLFSEGRLGSPTENLGKGKRLLRETLALRNDFHEARIYLGHAHHVGQENELAKREFGIVLDETADPIMRAFALENLGNVYLEEGQPRRGIAYFLELVQSGLIAREPRFFTTYFNLALAYGLLADFAECQTWFLRLHRDFPHKRRMIARELGSRHQFASVLGRHPVVLAELARQFPEWFPIVRGEEV